MINHGKGYRRARARGYRPNHVPHVDQVQRVECVLFSVAFWLPSILGLSLLAVDFHICSPLKCLSSAAQV